MQPAPHLGGDGGVALLGLRDQARVLLSAEAATADDTPGLAEQRTGLRAFWQAYVAGYGPVNRFTLRPIGKLDDAGGAAALEAFDPASQQAQPGGLLVCRQIEPRPQILGADNAHDALSIVLDQHGVVDLDAIALTGQSVAEARAELGEAIWQDPAAPGMWLTRAEYLSGDVRAKLDQARRAAVDDPDRWAGHVAALGQVIPADVGPGGIHARLGAVWISADDHRRFLAELLDQPRVRVAPDQALRRGIPPMCHPRPGWSAAVRPAGSWRRIVAASSSSCHPGRPG
ncbi:hypothetical protein [Microlunatus ginsengisoli]|uniref:Uncharacterized protein n=1 Tax=Microlunatus ginsengisoli TaxID=363863 RepID=A0ABP6ZMA5_9ACTN